MELKTESEYGKIKRQLNEVKVSSALLLDDTSEIPVVELIKEYYESDFFFKYNSYKFNHILNNYDAFNAMEDYFTKLGVVIKLK